MNSLLKTRIEAFENNALARGNEIVDWFFRMYKEVGVAEPIREFKPIHCAGDELWDLLLDLDACNKERVESEIGIKLEFLHADTCQVSWSGK